MPRAKVSPASRFAAWKQVVKNRENAVIVIYGNPDPDAMASAWALRELLRLEGVAATIGYTGEVGRLENQAMIQHLNIPLEPLDRTRLYSADLVAVVDAQPSFFKEDPLPRCHMVMDHHPVHSPAPEAEWVDIRPTRCATSAILFEYLEAADFRIPRRLATALFYGIQTDARNMMRPLSAGDREAILRLEPLVNRTVLRRIEFSLYSLSQLNYFAIALLKLRHVRNVLYCDIGPVPSADLCAQIADFLIRVRESNWALVSGVVGNRLVIVFRCDGHQKNAGRAAQAAFGAIGSAGGHQTMGRAEIEGSSLPEGTLLTQNEKIERFILGSLARVEPGFHGIYRAFLAESRAPAE
jgi:nanoRNase/pAp phosphatase (c-di-AMP/oligoRNAs hydrolase)